MEELNCRSDRNKSKKFQETLFVFLTKTENQMLNRVKSANRNEQQKLEFFGAKTENQSKNSLNRKTENPNAPILIEE